MDIPPSQIKPIYTPNPPNHPIQETTPIQNTIKTLNLIPHPEGGYYRETDRNPHRIPNPFAPQTTSNTETNIETQTRSASSAILYLLTPQRPLGALHRNQGRTVHVWQSGRGQYVIIHADEIGSQSQGRGCTEKRKARIETFVVGRDVARGEQVQWVVEGGKYKASFLLPDEVGGESSSGLLISELVIPGFEFADHNFLRKEEMEELLTAEQVGELSWMLKDTPNKEGEECI